MNLPNKITTVRMILVIIVDFLLLFPFEKVGVIIPVIGGIDTNIIYIVCGVLFIVASLSDFLDGYIARKYNLVTNYGKFMDPIADKLLVNSCLIILATRGPIQIPTVIVVVMIARDLIVDGIRLLAIEKGQVIAASWWGKIKTATQMVGISLVLFNDWPFRLIPNYQDGLITIIILFVAMTASLISGIIYVYNGRELFKGSK